MEDLRNKTETLSVNEEPGPWKTQYKNDHRYRGLAVIICNKHFLDQSGRGIDDKRTRHGTDQALESMKTTLASRGFIVEVIWNKYAKDIPVELDRVVKVNDVKNADCFLCVVASHGTWGEEEGVSDVIMGSDNLPVKIRDLTSIVTQQKCPDLDGKPKIFLLQCCRGRKYDRSVKVTQSTKSGQVLSAKNTGSAHQYIDGVKDDFDPEDLQTELALPHNLPVSRDYLLHYSTPLGYFSLRNGKYGSPFIQAWCTIIERSADTTDILSMATMVNALVVDEYTAKLEDKTGKHRRKLMPQVVSMLTKDFFLGKPKTV